MANKELVAIGGKATYRRVEILTTATGCVFFWNAKRFDCEDLEEATAAIDAIYASLVAIIIPAGAIN